MSKLWQEICLANQPEEPFIQASKNAFGRLSTVITTCRKQTRYDTTKQITGSYYMYQQKADLSILHKNSSRSRWPHGLRRGSRALRLLALWVRIPPGGWMCVSCGCCASSGRGLCDGLITRPEASYQMWCAWVWSWSLDNEEEALAHWGALGPWEKKK